MNKSSILYSLVVGFIMTVVMSLFFFPVNFTFFPIANSKMILAGFGLVWFFINLAQGNSARLRTDLFISSLLALFVSLFGLISVLLNNTSDFTYATYIVSMWVWLGAAYFCVNCIGLLHGRVTIELVAHYLIAVCVFQCTSALLIQYTPFFYNIATRYISEFSGIVSMGELINMNRLFGFGATLDVAGSRFAAILVIIGFMLTRTGSDQFAVKVPIYLICFAFITVVGNMIARTTVVGAIVSVLIWLSNIRLKRLSDNAVYTIWTSIFIVFIAVTLSIFLYNHNDVFRKDMRFAFEGFFSLVEDGYWHTNSNDRLENMYVFPDNTKTWLIGDGYFNNPVKTDPYYVGDSRSSYYMGTDVGYCRFIFYFGLLGLLFFSSFICVVAYYCSRIQTEFTLMFVMLLAVNFAVWLKVSTDIFLVFAPFLCLSNNGYSESGKHQ